LKFSFVSQNLSESLKLEHNNDDNLNVSGIEIDLNKMHHMNQRYQHNEATSFSSLEQYEIQRNFWYSEDDHY
jgi:hypothetical protein